MRALLIDDSKTTRRIQRGVLEELGCTEIEEAADGQDAMSRVSAFQPTLILLDWYMPNMDGLAFLKAFRKQDSTTPIIMVTTEAGKSRVIEAIRSGVNNFIIKPFTPDELRERITSTLERASAQA
ncbi:MAG: response regulator [Planctomycetota bacterium]|nr:MAG: response regulator [Planctomycetota bacterium]